MSGEPVTKKLCTSMKIGTHNGTFHCDEVFACAMLKHLPKYKDADIIRTRDPELLATCDIVVDVGGVFDPNTNRYDHHQRSFTDTMNSLRPEKKWTTKLSSAGLVYVHFGLDVLSQIMGTSTDDSITNLLYDKIYELFVEEIDAIDNGISQTDETPRYAVTTKLSSRVGGLSPRWNEKSSDDDMMERFNKAMRMVDSEFTDRILYYQQAWWPARTVVQEALEKRHEIDASGEVLALTQGGVPWKDHLMTMEAEQEITPTIKFVLFSDQSGKWRIQCVPAGLHSFENRLSLLKDWQGVRDSALSELSGIPGCIFVHASGFIGGNETYEGALQMARKTLEAAKKT